MTLQCRCCAGAVELVADNGATDPRDGDRWEQFRCEACGHTFTQVLTA